MGLTSQVNSAFALVLLAATLMLFSACTHQQVVKAQPTCANIDWFEVGRTDGSAGVTLDKTSEYADRCDFTEQPFDSELYTNGRNAGLMTYCTSAMGLEAGKAGLPYDGVCPNPLEGSYLSGYKVGERIRSLESENIDLQARIDNLVRMLTPSQSNAFLRAQIDELRTQRVQIDNEIGTLEEAAIRGQL